MEELTTDKDGKFSCTIPVKYLYGSKYSVVFYVATGEKEPVKKSFSKLLKPAQDVRTVKEELGNKTVLEVKFTPESKPEPGTWK